MLKRAWEARDFSDVTLVGEDDKLIHAHKIVLISCSSFFENILKKHSHPNPIIFVKGIPNNLLSSLLAFMYNGQVEVSKEDLEKFLEACADFNVRGLTSETEPFSQLDGIKPPPAETVAPIFEENLKSSPEKTKKVKEDDSKSDLIGNGGQRDFTMVEKTNVNFQRMWNKSEYHASKKSESMWNKSEYHTSKNPKPNNLSCNICDYKVHRNDLLKLHMNSKHNLEKFYCSVQACGKVYSSKINLKSHMKVNHNCEVCNVTFPSRTDLQVHNRRDHQ